MTTALSYHKQLEALQDAAPTYHSLANSEDYRTGLVALAWHYNFMQQKRGSAVEVFDVATIFTSAGLKYGVNIEHATSLAADLDRVQRLPEFLVREIMKAAGLP